MNEPSLAIALKVGFAVLGVWYLSKMIRRQLRARRDGQRQPHKAQVLRRERAQLLAITLAVGSGLILILVAPLEPPVWVATSAVIIAGIAFAAYLILEVRAGWDEIRNEIRDVRKRARDGPT